MIWYKFHIGDYLTHTIHLDDADDLAYRRLLDLYYLSEKPLSLDINSVAKKCRMDPEIIEPMLAEFFERTEEGWRNPRADVEIEKYNEKVASNRDAATARHAKTTLKKVRTANAVQMQCERTANASQTETETDTDKNKSISSQATRRFAEFWDMWPNSKRKVARAVCADKWQRGKLDELADKILANVGVLKASEQWLTGFEPAPLTYLNQRRWEDSLEQQSSGRRAI